MNGTCPRCGLPRPDAVGSCQACGQAFGPPSLGSTAVVPAQPLNAWQANAGRGMNKALIGLLLVLPLGLFALVGVAVAVNWDLFVASYEAGLADRRPIPRSPAGDEDVVAIGEIVDLLDGWDADLGSVTILGTSRPAELSDGRPPTGFRYVAAEVAYDARADWDYSTFDWSARDERQHRYDTVAWPPAPALVDGSLVAGRQATGWLAFLVPEGTMELWLDFVAADGSVVFTVQIDGSPRELPIIPAGPALPII